MSVKLIKRQYMDLWVYKYQDPGPNGRPGLDKFLEKHPLLQSAPR